MATFDPQAILDTVDAGTAPDIWKVYRARKSYFRVVGSLYIIIALFLALGAASGVVSLVISGLTDIWGAGTLIFVLLPLGILIALLAVYFARQGRMLLAQTDSTPKQVLVLTPEGVVGRVGRLPSGLSTGITSWPWEGTQKGRIFTIPYGKLASVGLKVTSSRYGTDFSLKLRIVSSQLPVLWQIDERFPDRDTIAQRIIEEHARYAAQHASMP